MNKQLAVMHIGYCNHNSYKKAVLIHYNMTFYSLYLFISTNTIQRIIVPSSGTLTVHDTYTGGTF